MNLISFKIVVLFDFYRKYHNFEKNKICTTGFWKWMDFSTGKFKFLGKNSMKLLTIQKSSFYYIWRWKWPSRDSIHLIIMIQTAWVCLWSILFILHEFYKGMPITLIQPLFFIEITYSKRASVWYNALTFPKWHFFTKIVLTYCEKKKSSSDWEKLLKLQNFWAH